MAADLAQHGAGQACKIMAEAAEEHESKFSAAHPWVGCPSRIVPLNAPWDAALQKTEVKAFKKAHGGKVPFKTLELMRFCNNYERTCKYTALSFLPGAIRLQFQKAANCYFLVIGTIYTFESVSPVAGMTLFGTLGALGVVLLAALLSEGLADLARHKQDTKMNAKPVLVLQGQRWKQVRWRDVTVGDFVKVLQNEAFPADFLVLASDNRAGRCYIETASLDGETNLKVYAAKKELVELLDVHPGGQFIGDEALIAKLRALKDATIKCTPPDHSLYSWSGGFWVAGEKLCNVLTEQLLLRGAVLRKSEWVVGVVVYTGMQTKLKMNDEETPPKTTQVEHLMNGMIFLIFKIQMLLVRPRAPPLRTHYSDPLRRLRRLMLLLLPSSLSSCFLSLLLPHPRAFWT
eukprot:COSAG05_NODE_510_length_9123_cov_3.605053_5_plen_403_part_00